MTQSGAATGGPAACRTCGHEPTLRVANCPRCGSPLVRTTAQLPDAALATTAATASAPSVPPPPPTLPPTPVPNPGQTVRRSSLGQVSESVSAPAPTPAPAPVPVEPPPSLAADGLAPVDIGRRVVASLIDGALATALIMALYVVLMVIFFASVMSGSSGMVTVASLVSLALYAVVIGGSGLYYVRSTGILGQTVGKRVMGVRVVDVTTHQIIGPGRALGRYFYQTLMGIPFGLGFITVFTDTSGWHRGWHDTMARTVVVSVPPIPFGRSVKDVWAAMRGRRP